MGERKHMLSGYESGSVLMLVISLLFLAIVFSLSSCSKGSDFPEPAAYSGRVVSENPEEVSGMSFTILSNGFANNGDIPARFTCKGDDISPDLVFKDIPAGTESLALIMDDPDAPGGTWVHWLLWNIDPVVSSIAEDSLPSGAVSGKNSFGTLEYGGPCPPSGTHRYFFKAYALNVKLELEQGAGKNDLEDVMKGHILAKAELVGLSSR